MTFEQALLAARQRPDDEAALSDLARSALAEGEEELALPLLRRGAERMRNARLWQWTGLLDRSLDQHVEALSSFEKAAALAPSDRSIAHGLARITIEAGLPSVELFKAALRLSPTDGDVLLGYVASLVADGQAQFAESVLAEAVARSPFWVDGHTQLAQLRSTVGKRDEIGASLQHALSLHPQHESLWIALFRLLQQAEQFVALDEAIVRARRHLLSEQILRNYEAIAAVERKDADRADRLFEAMTPGSRQSIEIWRIRHLLRTGKVAEACAAVDRALQSDLRPNIWPYAAIAWQLAGDRRWDWLQADLERTVSVIDLTSDLPDLAALEGSLRKLHRARGEYLDQSVRGGSQTDGPLLTRIDPHIQGLRAAIVRAVESHVRNFPPPDPEHPLLGPRRDRGIRFAGSWSVLLRNAGYHANHVHPQGWISSALYIRLPTRRPDEAKDAGWLTLGEPQAELGLDLKPFREIEPKVGHLALFPSYMWHGTRTFAEGERLTVAFDVRRSP